MGRFTCLLAIGFLVFGLDCCHGQLTSCADVQSCVTYLESSACNAFGQRETVCITHTSCSQITTDITSGCANAGTPVVPFSVGQTICSPTPLLGGSSYQFGVQDSASAASTATLSLGGKSVACTFSSTACSSGGNGFVLSLTVTSCPCACGAWSNWGGCSATCGSTAVQTRTRTCNVGCLDPTSSTQACPGVPTVCGADGTWNTWGSWSTCSVTCGGSTQTRTRTCNRPTGGADCVGSSSETQNCGTANCPACMCNPWQNWSVCSVSCGGNAFRTRTRTCSNCVTFMPVLEQTGVCQGVAAECPMDGMWTQWNNWNACPVTCGGSSQSRMRICTDPTAGGQDCPGLTQESRPCNQAVCPIPTFPPPRRGNRRRGGRRRGNRSRGRQRGCRAIALRGACRSARRGRARAACIARQCG